MKNVISFTGSNTIQYNFLIIW